MRRKRAGASPTSLVRRLTLALAAIVGVSTAVVVALFAASVRRAEEAEVRRNIVSSAAAAARLVEPALWDLDMDRAAAIGEAFAHDPRVVRLTVRAAGGEWRMIRRRDAADTLGTTAPVVHGRRTIGTVDLVFSRALYRARFEKQVRVTVAVGAVVLLATLLGLRLLLARFLRRPLDELTATVRRYADGDHLPRSAPAPCAEFEPFRRTLDVMAARIRGQLETLNGANTRLALEVCERRRAEDEARQSRKVLALVMDAVPQSIFWKDRDSVYLGANAVFAAWNGLESADDVVGKTDRNLPSAGHTDAVYREIDRLVMESRVPYRGFVERMARPDGGARWVETTKVPLTDETGRVFGLLGVSEDITERRLGEEALRWRNQELATLNRFLRVASTAEEPAPLLTEACRELAETLGLPYAWALLRDGGTTDGAGGEPFTVVAEFTGTPRESRVGLPPAAFAGALAAECLERGAAVVCPDVASDPRFADTVGRTRRGGVASALAVPLTADGGPAAAIVLASPDARTVSEEEVALASTVAAQAAAALARQRAHAAERLLHVTIEQIPESLLVTDVDGRIRYVNAAFTAAMGYAREEAIGARARDVLVDVPGSAGFADTVEAALRDGRRWSGQVTKRRKDGTTFVEEVEVTPVRGARGEVTHVVRIGRDVTEELTRAERTRHAQKMEAVGQLAGGVAHDFNNIIAAVQLQLELLEQDHALEPVVRAAIRDVRASAERAANVTRQLLLFSRRQAMTVRRLDLDVVIADLLRMLSRLLGEQVTVRLERAAAPLPVDADLGMLEQVVTNLCVNARDAMPRGGTLTLRTREVTVDGARWACVEVADTGCGMSPETVGRIFEPFFTTKEVGKGTGLGLATSHGIVVQHRGWIDVTSAPGAGSTFRVHLPIAEGDAASGTASGAASGTPATAGEGETAGLLVRPEEGVGILVVEDEGPVRRTAARALRRLGYRVHEAADVAEGLRAFAEHRDEIALVLTDMVMPGEMSGLELGARLRAMSPGVEIVLMTGYCVELGELGELAPHPPRLLLKPFTLATLRDTVQEVLRGGGEGEGADRQVAG